MRALLPAFLILLASLTHGNANAQSAQDRRAAANAYDRGTTAFLQDDFARAARWFETANNLAPAAPALQQAIRSHQRAGNTMRAGTLGLRLLAEFPDSSAAPEAQAAVDAASPLFVRVRVDCADCSAEVDGTLQGHTEFFLEPDVEYQVGGAFETGSVSDTFRGIAGEERSLSFEAPAPEETVQEIVRETGSTNVSQGTREPEEESGGLSPALFYTSLALTVGAGAVLIWSGLDTLSGVDPYEEAARNNDPAAADLLADGQSRELRTNVLIGVTAGLGALTVLFLALTDFGGDDEDDRAQAFQLRPIGGISPSGASVGLMGAF